MVNADFLPEPDSSKLRTWSDRSKTFKVEAQFLGCKDGKIHLHKSNGVKIAVPVAKMSVEDLEYVERITGLSLDEDKPLSYVKHQQGQQSQQQRAQQQQQLQKSGITIEKPSSGDKKNDYDWFDFFLGCGIDLGQCQRYALNFQKENMDETFLPDLSANSMRSLGMKEGDIIRATKFLDNKYNRSGGSDTGKKAVSFGNTEVIGENGGEGSSGGLFSGPGGVLRNNTGRKGRPAPAVLTSDTVDPNAFLQKSSPPPTSKSPSATGSGSAGGFEDDAWAPKPSKQAPQQQPQPPAEPPKPATPLVAAQPPPPPAPPLHPDIAGLSLDTPPLQPTVVNPPPAQSISPQPSYAAQARQRPAAPSPAGPAAGSLILPPPQRPISAPQTFHQNNMMGAMPPMQPQLTGLPLTSTAPPGQLSMSDQLHNMRMQQIQQQQESLAQTQRMIMAQMTGANPLIAHATGLVQQQQTGLPLQQPTGFMNGLPMIQQPQPQMPQQSFQPLINQPTGMMQQHMMQQPTGMMQQQPTGMNMGMGMGGMTGFRGPGPVSLPVNSLLQPALMPQQTGLGAGMQPLKPQATGPPPPVRFGVQPGAPKLAPQATGKRANLSQASKSTFMQSLCTIICFGRWTNSTTPQFSTGQSIRLLNGTQRREIESDQRVIRESWGGKG